MRSVRPLLSVIMTRGGLYLLAIITIVVVEGRKTPLDNIELERRLNLINKPPVMSIQLDYAIFDCIDIYKQPAFDHPLLKNHKIQIKELSLCQSKLEGKKCNEVELEPSQLPSHARKETPHHKSVFVSLSPGCPNGTVPIRRTTKDDLIREQSVEDMKISQFYPKSPGANSNTNFATLSIVNESYPFLGGDAYNNIQQPQTYPGESSGAQVWIFNASDDGTVINGISAGWMVDKQFYGDGRTYFTASWVKQEKDGPVGCFNIRCSGFVQVDQSSPLGGLLNEVSTYGGPLKDIRTFIYRDDVGNWWLHAGEDQSNVGYWPAEVLPQLANGANSLHFGGVVKFIPTQLSPPMGSGISEECQYKHTSYFSNLGYILSINIITPYDVDTIKYANCDNYKILPSCEPVDTFKYYFMYGGSRGRC